MNGRRRSPESHLPAKIMASKKSSLPAVDAMTEKQTKTDHARVAGRKEKGAKPGPAGRAKETAGHDRRYYQEDAPTVTDAEYDELRRRYTAIEARFPQLATRDSLSQRVGAAPSPRFAKVRHAV